MELSSVFWSVFEWEWLWAFVSLEAPSVSSMEPASVIATWAAPLVIRSGGA
eukprot:gene7550-5428_t